MQLPINIQIVMKWLKTATTPMQHCTLLVQCARLVAHSIMRSLNTIS